MPRPYWATAPVSCNSVATSTRVPPSSAVNHESIVADVRGSGFFLGLELRQEADRVVNQMREHRILLGTEGPRHNVIKIRPPMPFDQSDADRLVTTLAMVLG